MTLTLLWLQLAGAAAIILVSGNFLAKSADVIAFKTGLGRSFIGVVLLATATSLPELGTGVTSVAIGEPDLAVGDAFGSNLFNLLIIGLVDIFWRSGPILNSVSMTSVIVASLGIVVISLAAIAALIHGLTQTMAGWYISPVSVLLFVVFLGAMFLIYRFEHPRKRNGEQASAQVASPQENPTIMDQSHGPGAQVAEHEYAAASLARAGVTYLLAAAFVVGAAIWLANTGDKVAKEMGWEASFVGTLFLAFSTSLPELAASFAAIRIRAPELAISGVLGSNLFNMGFILFIDDLAFSEGALWAHIADIHTLTAFMAVLMTAVVIFALVSRGRRRPSTFWTVESVLLIGLYVASSLLVFFLS